MKKNTHPLVALSLFLLCANFSEQSSDSVVGDEKPEINVYGALEDTSGNSYQNVQNITIGRMYKEIPAYKMPPNKDDDPADNSTFLDLAEIQNITTPHPDVQHTFNNRDYIEIQVTSQGGHQDNYIVEISRRVSCDVAKGNDLVRKELKFSVVRKITIAGYRRQPKEKLNKTTNDKSST